MEKYYLVSSNEDKLKEFKNILPEIKLKKGIDLKEVLSNSLDVILYKVLELGQEYNIVEDTILEIYIKGEWKELVDIRFLIEKGEISQYEGLKARWLTSLGVLKNEEIFVYRGIIDGVLSFNKYIKDSFGFDSFFYPNGKNKSLFELNKEGLKSNYSARHDALINFKQNNIYYQVLRKDVPIWNGSYQK